MSIMIFRSVQSDPIRHPIQYLKVCLLTSDFCIVPPGLFWNIPMALASNLLLVLVKPPQAQFPLLAKWHLQLELILLRHWGLSYGQINVTRLKCLWLENVQLRVNLGGWKAVLGLWQLLSHARHWGLDSLGAKLRGMGCNGVWDGLFNIRAVCHFKPSLSFSSS